MPKYSYKAKNRQGKLLSGEISANSKLHAQSALSNKGLKPVKLVAISAEGSEATQAKGLGRFIYRDKNGNYQLRLSTQLPTTRELALFTKQFSMMIENGVPMLQALQMLKEQQQKVDFANILAKVSSAIEQGSTLTDALEPYPAVFDTLYVSMAKAGETSGKLDVIMRQLVLYIEKSARMKAQVKSALSYPIIILVVAISVVTLLLTFVVPNFAKQFTESGQELPYLTQLVINISDALTNNWMEIAGTLIASGIALKYIISSEKGRVGLDAFLLKAPILGNVMTKIAIGRFCSTMATTMNSGVSILEALTICAASSGNKSIESFIGRVKESISRGSTFSEPLGEGGLFPKMVIAMVAVGEATGTLDQTLKKVTEIYEEEVDNAVKSMMSMIEPVLLVGIGGIVGFIVIAMYLPIFSMASAV